MDTYDCDAEMYQCDCRVCMARFYARHCDQCTPSLLWNGRGGFSPETQLPERETFWENGVAY